MSLSTIWYHCFKFLSNFIKFTKREKVRFVKRVGKLAKFAISSQDVMLTRCVSQLGNIASQNFYFTTNYQNNPVQKGLYFGSVNVALAESTFA